MAAGLPALYFAATGSRPEIAGVLVTHGADVNDASPAAAPLHGAVMGRSPEMVRWLLERGADPSLPDFQGRSAREPAEAMGRPDLAALFD